MSCWLDSKTTVDVKKSMVAWTFGAKSGLVHNTIMEAAQRVRYPIERWPNEFAREDAPYQWNWDKYDRIPGLSMAQVHWILDSDPNNGGDSKQKTIPSFPMKQKWSTKQAFSLKTIVPIISTPRRLRGIISDTKTTLTESYGHTKINDRINCSRWSKECRAFQLVKLSEDPKSIEGWSLSV